MRIQGPVFFQQRQQGAAENKEATGQKAGNSPSQGGRQSHVDRFNSTCSINRLANDGSNTRICHGGMGCLFIKHRTNNDDPGHEIAFVDEILEVF